MLRESWQKGRVTCSRALQIWFTIYTVLMSKIYNSWDEAHEKNKSHVFKSELFSRKPASCSRVSLSHANMSYAASICRALSISSPLLHKMFPSHSYWINQSHFIFIAPFWKIHAYPFPVILKRKIIHTTQLRIKHTSSWWCLSGSSSNGCWLLKLLNMKSKIDY